MGKVAARSTAPVLAIQEHITRQAAGRAVLRYLDKTVSRAAPRGVRDKPRSQLDIATPLFPLSFVPPAPGNEASCLPLLPEACGVSGRARQGETRRCGSD
ncbi:hypothetical protein E2C01_075485 [Portunus trituberculatus]|uniref:Uncharacterized protein n=1 Tax=Portunus trituberculatus TaxID=210409 RepID=A0A5B7IG96_PORTR|nr:hypothetical protein [Portunus trituberculatus]